MSQVDICNVAANMGMETDTEYAGRSIADTFF
jgi:hypothetical protein